MKIEEFRKHAQSHNVIPVYRKLLADGETPLNIYKKLAQNKPGTFLLESAEHGGVWSRYSFIGVKSQTTLTEKDGQALWIGKPPVGVPTGVDPLTALRQSVAHLKSPKIEGLPTLTGGLVGYMGYDAVRRLEKLPTTSARDIELPEIAFMLTSDLVVMDHSDGTIILIANAINWDGSSERVDDSYLDAVSRLDRMQKELLGPIAGDVSPLPSFDKPIFDRNMSEQDFKSKVEIAKEEIRAGEAFQIVLSQRFSMPTSADALDIYRMLRLNNPSPYMYLFRFEDGYDVVGSSPEALVKVTGKQVMVHPIAGTRKRSDSIEEDVRLGEELLADPKERAEHLMLVDLGRNDLGRICAPGSVEVIDFMHIERYSHVMHIVSTVVGELASDKSPIDALFSVFPAGTLSGAPKPRAMEIIESLEPTRRALYGGAIGYFDFTGNIDTCIAIRTALVHNGIAYVQAGAGIVADSDPTAENDETLNKAAAVLGAIAAANEMKR
ncbi:anthranilate synthase component I [Candidatus Planktophila versatilis]|uniref:Anthranilate synthase component 1 n=1 Tax=Candidatus Planktophila versatilis TaxID=1884905 RepID=A0ABM6MEJ7_9ACTN|nr:anthranilate synthase component I [Candidatus Planktophila versatilis]ASY17152.1 anthranilate synthase component I [Candidatus Planktophila versatilis]